jgi:LDH2 family malate/lactate/ureidoglycolate dehydrogenase
MLIPIKEIQDTLQTILSSWGFSSEEVNSISENFIESELMGKKSHGLVRMSWLKKILDAGKIAISPESISIDKETPVSLLVNGKGKTGFFVISKALELGIQKAKASGLVAVGVTNTAAASGMIGLYARKAAEANLIYIGFNGSPKGLVPHGSIDPLWGTNPFTIGIPTKSYPFILDMASAKGTIGGVLLAKSLGVSLPAGVAIDSQGQPTQDPDAALKGGLLPIEGHKGSGLAMAVTLLAGPLVSSLAGEKIKGGWGSFFILIDPLILRDLEEFKNEVEIVTDELKNSRKQQGVNEIYYPGEKSQKLRQTQLEKGALEVDENLWSSINNLK